MMSMEIVEITKVEDCADGSGLYKCLLNGTWTRDIVLSMHNYGKLEYFPDFPRPFFRLTKPDGMQIKGVEGENICLILLPSDQNEKLKKAGRVSLDVVSPDMKGTFTILN